MLDFEYEVDMIVESYLDEFEPVHEIGDTPAGQRALVKVADRANKRIDLANQNLTSFKNGFKARNDAVLKNMPSRDRRKILSRKVNSAEKGLTPYARSAYNATTALHDKEIEKNKKNRANAVKRMSKDTLANNTRWAEPKKSRWFTINL